MPLLKRLSQLSVFILLLSVLAISFHYHGDLADHPECTVCRLAKSLSAAKKPTQQLLSGHIGASSHDLSAGELPAQIQLPLPACVRRASAPNGKERRETVVSRTAASRASPLLVPLLCSII